VLNGSCVKIEGTLVDSPGKEQKEKKLKEVQVKKIEVIGTSSDQVSNHEGFFFFFLFSPTSIFAYPFSYYFTVSITAKEALNGVLT
jgi:hypothetical protein